MRQQSNNVTFNNHKGHFHAHELVPVQIMFKMYLAHCISFIGFCQSFLTVSLNKGPEFSSSFTKMCVTLPGYLLLFVGRWVTRFCSYSCLACSFSLQCTFKIPWIINPHSFYIICLFYRFISIFPALSSNREKRGFSPLGAQSIQSSSVLCCTSSSSLPHPLPPCGTVCLFDRDLN